MCSKSPLLRVRKIDPCFWDRYVVWLIYCWYWHVPTWATHFFSFSLLLGTTYLRYMTLRWSYIIVYCVSYIIIHFQSLHSTCVLCHQCYIFLLIQHQRVELQYPSRRWTVQGRLDFMSFRCSLVNKNTIYQLSTNLRIFWIILQVQWSIFFSQDNCRRIMS